MSRLGAKYTVSGYLDEVSKRSFLVLTKDGPANLKKFFEQLPQDWTINDFVSLFEREQVPLGWGYEIEYQRSALGKQAKIVVYLPSAAQIIHHSEDGSGPLWSEKVLTAHAWSVTVRKGKAKLDVIPTSLFVSEHALRRLYERSGGCSYEKFPQLTSSFMQELINNSDTLLREFVLIKINDGKYATAVPTSSGLAVMNWSIMFVSPYVIDFGVLISIKGHKFKRGRGSFHPSDFWDLPKLDSYGVGIHRIPAMLFRTYYGDEDISDARRESCTLLNVLLNNAKISDISPSKLINSEKNCSGLRKLPNIHDLLPMSSSGLRADIIDSLFWINSDKNDALHFAPYVNIKRQLNLYNEIDWEALGDVSAQDLDRMLDL